MNRIFFTAIALASIACSKSDAPAPSPSAPAASAFAQASASAPTPARQATAWSGAYEASVGTLFVPDGGEWSGVKFRGDDAGVGLGKGTITLTVDPTGHARGTMDGALGVLDVTGILEGGVFTARLAPKDVKGFTGSAFGHRDGEKISGSMHFALANGSVIREASFTIARGTP